jgi:chromosome segregation ATPase
MSENNILNIIDGTLRSVEDNFKKFIEVLNAARNELIDLEKDKATLSQDKSLLEQEKNQLEEATSMLETEKELLEHDKMNLEQEKTKLEKETQKLEKEKKERDQRIGELTSEQLRLLEEYKTLKVELNKFAKITQDQEEAEFNFERIKALLSITMLLIEEIWQGQPHYRILLTLHGEKEEMSREEIKNTTGISGAMVLRAVHELSNVGILQYDENTSIVKLTKRLFDKKALTEGK